MNGPPTHPLPLLFRSSAEPTSPTPIFASRFCMHGSFPGQDEGKVPVFVLASKSVPWPRVAPRLRPRASLFPFLLYRTQAPLFSIFSGLSSIAPHRVRHHPVCTVEPYYCDARHSLRSASSFISTKFVFLKILNSATHFGSPHDAQSFSIRREMSIWSRSLSSVYVKVSSCCSQVTSSQGS